MQVVTALKRRESLITKHGLKYTTIFGVCRICKHVTELISVPVLQVCDVLKYLALQKHHRFNIGRAETLNGWIHREWITVEP